LIAGELQRQGVRFHQDDNAFLSISDPEECAIFDPNRGKMLQLTPDLI
jgi:hypothetical protein